MIADWLLGPVVTCVSAGILLSLLVNLRTVPRLRARYRRPAPVLVSLLVPARDEEATIGVCLEGLLAQDHERVEIIVLDDRSSDATAEVVRSFAHRGVRLVGGEPLPPGWTGKNWACDQLARVAAGDVLCFVDADTTLAPAAVGAAVEVLQASDAGLVTALLAAEYRTAAQATLLPIVNHALLALFPVWLMHRSVAPRVALGLGPFMMVTRAAYDDVGGHAAAPGEIVDDVRLTRAVKGAGHRVRLANGTRLMRTRWYRDLQGIWRGFAKNAFGAIDSNVPLAILTVFVLVPLLCAPFVRVPLALATGSVPVEALVQVALILTARTITSVACRDPLRTVPLHPVAVVIWGATLAWSAVLALGGRSVRWRGRDVVVRARVR